MTIQFLSFNFQFLILNDNSIFKFQFSTFNLNYNSIFKFKSNLKNFNKKKNLKSCNLFISF